MLDDSIIDYHRGVLRTENQEISDFLARYGWKMKTTSTGLRYLIYKKGIGKKPVKGMTVEIGYSVRLLDGTLCYSSDSLGNKRFRIGYEEVESGLEEGIFLLNQGDRAKLIIPSHLAFGLLGDQKKIPPGSALVYDVDLVTLHNR
jgi:FKBP-type peptidyl-prolyl cis-trans isomerase